MVKHINIVAILFMIWGGFQLVMALFVGLVFSGLGGLLGVIGLGGDEELLIMGGAYFFIGIFVAVIAGVMSLPSIIAGFGLMKRAGWARILALIVGAMALMSVPMGTMLGIYAFITLLDAEVADEFAAAN